jgi:hypothetical protein
MSVTITYRLLMRWAPRWLAVLMILFLGLFALDVFSEGYTFGELLVALFMHLIPNILLLIALIVAWRWRVAGGVLFLALATISVFFFHTYQHISTFLLISFPVFVIGILFLVDWWLDHRQDQQLAAEH